jgi:hypothetical protein
MNHDDYLAVRDLAELLEISPTRLSQFLYAWEPAPRIMLAGRRLIPRGMIEDIRRELKKRGIISKRRKQK